MKPRVCFCAWLLSSVMAGQTTHAEPDEELPGKSQNDPRGSTAK
jgi:hypothetical protein